MRQKLGRSPQKRTGLLYWWRDRVLHDVTAALGATPEEVLRQRGVRAERRIAQARAVTAWLLREMTTATSTELGLILRCDHTTVLYLHRLVQTEIKAKQGFYLFALQNVLMHARVSGPLLAEANDRDQLEAP